MPSRCFIWTNKYFAYIVDGKTIIVEYGKDTDFDVVFDVNSGEVPYYLLFETRSFRFYEFHLRKDDYQKFKRNLKTGKISDGRFRCVRVMVFWNEYKNGRLKEMSSRGTGIILQTGKVLTVHHCFRPSSRIYVNGKRASVIKTSKEDDLLLLKVETHDVPPVNIRGYPEKGSEVYMVGNPYGRRKAAFFGKVKTFSIKREFYTDMKLGYPYGGSGSGVYMDSKLVGIMKAITCLGNKGLERCIQERDYLAYIVSGAAIKEFLGRER